MNIRITSTLLLASLAAVLSVGCASQTQEHFDSPEKAVDTLVSALRADDQATLTKVLGKDASQVLDSGDPVADRNGREAFLADYDAKHSLEAGANGAMTLCVGTKDWPLPIPVVKAANNGWYFDTAAGREEIINRRVGRNELRTIQTCLAIVDAQREYALLDPDHNGINAYARQFLSTAGKRDGLYWPIGPSEAPSPLGELVSEAADEGYAAARASSEGRRPFHGYYYRMLTGQGPDAPGGAFGYIVKGEMLAGFGVIAWPAEYGNSGVMTFIVNQDGVVYEQDLGGTAAANAIKVYNPGPGWKRSDTTPQPE